MLFIISPELKAHWWAYRIGRPPPSVVRRTSTFSNIFSSETTKPIKTKFHVEPLWDGGTKVYSNGPGHMTKMAAMPICGKTLKIFFSGTKRSVTLKLGMQQWVFEYCSIYSNDEPGLTLTYLTARSNLPPYAFVWGKSKTIDISETIVVYDVKMVDAVN